jgi:hypothetical protein
MADHTEGEWPVGDVEPKAAESPHPDAVSFDEALAIFAERPDVDAVLTVSGWVKRNP